MRRLAVLVVVVIGVWSRSSGQMQPPADTLRTGSSLADCVQYALTHRPILQQSRLDEDITGRQIAAKLADWFPQINFNLYVQRNPQPPVSLVGGTPVPTLLAYTSSGQISASQVIFNRDVLLAASTAGDLREQSTDRTASTSIDVIVNVSKAYYAVLLTREQIALLDEDIIRLTQSLKDARDQYESGVVDKIDFERASIALNNATAERNQAVELLDARVAMLRQQMGYPSDADLTLARDTTGLEEDMALDTTRVPHIEQRIEFQLLQVQKRLLEANVRYNWLSFLPSVSAYGSYNYNYQDNHLADIFRHDFPSSWIGLQLTFPLLEGGKRYQEIGEAKLELQRIDYDIDELQQSVNAEYLQALAEYKSSLNSYNTLKENLALAREVYKTVQLQYSEGTKAYLEVITAETDLRSAQVNETDALYQVLSSKLDVLKALGAIHE